MAEKLLELELNNNHSLKGYPIQNKILIFQIKCLKCNCIIDKTDIKMYKHKRETLQTDWLHAFFYSDFLRKKKLYESMIMILKYVGQLWRQHNSPILTYIGKLDIFPLICAAEVWITELILIHKNIRSVRYSHV